MFARTYVYDGAGNIKAMGTDTFSYDSVSRVIAAKLMDGQAMETNDYDAFGNRTATTTTSGSRTIDVVAFDDLVLDEGQTLESCSVLTSDNVVVDTTEEVRFRAGLLIELSDFTVASGSDVVLELDADLKSDFHDLDYMHARFAKPSWGRFLSVDPVPRIDIAIQAPQLWNLYSYAANNPLKYIDPNGEFIQLPQSCVDNDQCDELLFLRQTLIEAGAADVAAQITVTNDGRVVLDSDFQFSSNSTVRKLATAINLEEVGTRLTSTSEDLSAFGGALTTFNSDDDLFEIRINKRQTGDAQFLFEGGVYDFLSGGEIVIHEIGHFMAASGALSNRVLLGSEASKDNALMYENLHRASRGGTRASLVRRSHDAMRSADEQ